MGLGFRVFRIIFMRLKPLVSKRAWNMFFSKNVGLGFIRGKMFPKHDSINQMKYLQLQSPQKWKWNAAAFMIMLFHEKTTSSTQNLALYPAASVSFSESWQHFLHLTTTAFQSMSDPSRVPAMHPASPQNLLNPFPLCVSCRLQICTHLTILWEWKGSNSDISGRLYWGLPIHDPVSKLRKHEVVYIW